MHILDSVDIAMRNPTLQSSRKCDPHEGIENDVFAIGLIVTYMLAQGRHMYKDDADFKDKSGRLCRLLSELNCKYR
ncbi:hypothetical protein F2Q70_00045252 [Brassica cretica]|uniref:Uncharacterized protein n=1 Tax=Brassica cretica TaxID=69181 RepID=A0A8S9KGH3_BRACR|nr:hypothetical protein F2Q70_00045252 [Brassica cretica]